MGTQKNRLMLKLKFTVKDFAYLDFVFGQLEFELLKIHCTIFYYQSYHMMLEALGVI